MSGQRCYKCGGPNSVHPLAKAGRTRRYKDVPVMAIPSNVEIPTCSNCGAEWVGLEDAKRIDAALEEVYQRRQADDAVLDLLIDD